jgi:RNA recognition motif. (a.k.a. RRM, RBD, or RNP domain)
MFVPMSSKCSVQEEDLIALFNTTAKEPQLDGAVEAVRVVRDGHTSLGKGIAYVLFTNRTTALAALNLDGAECRGRLLRVQRVKASAGGAAAVKVAPNAKGRPQGLGASRRLAGGKAGGFRVGGNAEGALLSAMAQFCQYAWRAGGMKITNALVWLQSGSAAAGSDCHCHVCACRLCWSQNQGQAQVNNKGFTSFCGHAKGRRGRALCSQGQAPSCRSPQSCSTSGCRSPDCSGGEARVQVTAQEGQEATTRSAMSCACEPAPLIWSCLQLLWPHTNCN